MPYLWSYAKDHPDDLMLALGRMAWAAREMENLGQRICSYLVDIPMNEFISKSMLRANERADLNVPAERALAEWIAKAVPVFDERNSIVHGHITAIQLGDFRDEPFLLHRRHDKRTNEVRANVYSLEAEEFDRVRLMCEELSVEAARIDISLAARGHGV